MVTLVNGRHAKEMRWGSGGGGGAFASPVQGSQIVSGIFDSTFANVVALGNCFLVQETAGQFQVRIVDITGGVGECDKPRLNGGVNWTPPDNGIPVLQTMPTQRVVRGKRLDPSFARNGSWSWEPYSTGPMARRIMSTDKSGVERNKFLQSSWAVGEVVVQPLEVV